MSSHQSSAEATQQVVQGKQTLLDLKALPCVGHGGDLSLLNASTARQLASQLCQSWEIKGETEKLIRTFRCTSFATALEAVNAYGGLAEHMGHHPDLSIAGWNSVTISFHTHALGGLSINDFIVAAHSDKVPVSYSQKWLQANPSVTAGREKQIAAIPASAKGYEGSD